MNYYNRCCYAALCTTATAQPACCYSRLTPSLLPPSLHPSLSLQASAALTFVMNLYDQKESLAHRLERAVDDALAATEAAAAAEASAARHKSALSAETEGWREGELAAQDERHLAARRRELAAADAAHAEAAAALQARLEAARREELESIRLHYTLDLDAKATEANKGALAMRASRDEALATLESTLRAFKLRSVADVQRVRAETERALASKHGAVVAAVADERDAAFSELRAARAAFHRVSQARSAAHNQLVELQGNIRVMCRVRPPLYADRSEAAAVACGSSSDVTVRDGG